MNNWQNKIEISFNAVGMPIFECSHVKGYSNGKGQRLCFKCQEKIIRKLRKVLK
jgi:hypothetical protein